MAERGRGMGLVALTVVSMGSAAAGFVALAVEDAAAKAVAPANTSAERPARVLGAKRRVPAAVTRSSR